MRWLMLFGLVASITAAQDLPSNIHQATTTPMGARFEIVQSQLSVKWTYLLDRYTGEVFELVKTKDQALAWDAMRVSPAPILSKKPTGPRFQIFTSGLVAKNTFLLDTYSGFTWVVTAKGEWVALSQVKVN